MRVEHNHLLPYPRQLVWDVLLDPDVMSRILPGVEKFEPAGEDRFHVVLQLGVPAVTGTYSGSVEIANRDEPSSYELIADGKGSQGWVRGTARLELSDEGEGTRVVATADAQIGGRIASVGQRLVDGVAKTMARELFASIERELSGREQTTSSSGFALRMLFTWLQGVFARLLGRQSG